ncbi:hypothetical protein YC2023_033310 [Brassica napus]
MHSWLTENSTRVRNEGLNGNDRFGKINWVPKNRHRQLDGFYKFNAPLYSNIRNARTMAASQISLSEMKPKRCTRTIVTAVLWFREAKNVKKSGELMGSICLLLDDQDLIIR